MQREEVWQAISPLEARAWDRSQDHPDLALLIPRDIVLRATALLLPHQMRHDFVTNLDQLSKLRVRERDGATLTADERMRLADVMPFNMDTWGGYPTERQELYTMLKAHGKENVVVCSGDSHDAWCAPGPGPACGL